MIIKERDATKNRIAYIESYEAPGMDSIQRQGLKQAAARLRADCTKGDACRQIDSYFAESRDWLVIHDLRVQHAQQIIQINHLLISSTLKFYIVDSRYLKNGLTLNESGQCWIQGVNHNTPIASPLNKMNRDIRILRDIIKNAKELPRFLGISPTISVEGYILTNPALKSHKPPSSALNSSSVIASDMLFASVWEKRQSWMRSKVINADEDSLYNFSQALLSLHIPAVSSKLMGVNLRHYKHAEDQQQDTSHCAHCGEPVTAYVREQCFRRMGVYRGLILCVVCQAAEQNQSEQSALPC